MKICFTVDSMKPGGAERVVSILANNFSKLGHKVYIVMVSSLDEKSFYNIGDAELICLLADRKKRTNFIKRTKLLKLKISEINPDVVISFLPHVTIYTFFALRHSKVKFICSERNDPSKLGLKYRLLLKYIFKRASGNVFQTSEAQKWYKKHVSKYHIRIFNPIVSNVVYCDINKRKNKIVSTGRLVSQKNFYLLIDAFELFFKCHLQSNYFLKIYGVGPLKDELQHYALKKGISNNVIFLGNSKTWLEDEKDAKMFVLSSNFEGMPNSLMEALASGIPCVSTNCPVGGPSELIEDGTNGLLVPVNNVNKMLEAMNKLDNDNYGYKLSTANKYTAFKYNEDKISNEWLNFINKVIGG